ncbi:MULTISPECIES: type IVB secretion system protein IcmJDotN [Vibrio]|uniref:HNH nuclease domain-containing protein n=3 Tax=Vibrio TaxID=662 RepID=A0AAX0MBL5_VIBPH|nr:MULTISPECIES: type IVB secretion system protein IcmJDotN [Vibrio]EJG0764707.1 type IVB secretion system protein IcmJDotN [Vibrio parahaemolyticus O5:K30]MCS0330592.1 type IVB secretion system protein IcmJDotN [Vibrio diabolicus]TVN08342.1 HNH endonuclease [Vibrio cholerae]ARN69548.1 IcmJ (DotN) protein [Vibrio vulnificus]EGQ8302328.1 HNH endonuclease [Vibrio parahaemolyticus]
MKIREIILSVKRSTFRVDDPFSDESNPEFKKNRKIVLERDGFSCQCCGFKAEKFQDVHHIDDNHNNNKEDNLITVCPLCHMCHHLGHAGAKEMGDLIHIDPKHGLTQASLNSLVRFLWLAEGSSNKEFAQNAVSLYNRLHLLSVNAKRVIGTSKPELLARHLLSLSERDYGKRKEKLEGIYFLPSKSGFTRQLEYWRKLYDKNNPPDKWIDNASARLLKWFENEHGDADTDNAVASYLNSKRV